MKHLHLTRALMLTILLTSSLSKADTLDHSGSDTFALEAAAMLEQHYYAAKSAVSAQPKGAAAAVRIGAGSLGKASGGEWSAIIPWTPHIPVTAATLPDGRILTFASNERTAFPGGPEFTYAATWNPSTGAFQEINNTRHDMFCGGVAMLPDGRVHIAGGRTTSVLGSVFDWRTNSWSAIQDMNDRRWYNTNITLPDGQVAAFSGSGGVNTVERWNGTSWARLTGINWSVVTSEPGDVPNWHPFLSVAPSGQLIHFGPTDVMHWVNAGGTGSLTNTGTNVPGAQYPKEGSWVVYNEGRVLVAGGGSSAANTYLPTNAAYTVDFRNGTPIVSSTGSMKFARSFANAVALPNGEVLVMGGNNSGVKFSDAGAVLAPEIWNPNTGTWREVTDGAVPRAYHSVALLLKDGRVLSAGGGLGGGDHRDGEVFTPPNLFNLDGSAATRPVISSAPVSIGLGTTFNVSATAGLSRFTFIRLAAITHSVTTDLRFLELPFTEVSPGNYRVTGRASANVMIPGYWYLYGLNSAGAHSVAAIIQVNANNVVTLANPGNQSNVVNNAITPLQIQASEVNSDTFNYTATGLPTGVQISAATGLITGTPTVIGVTNTVVTVKSNTTTIGTTSFTWTINATLSLAPISGSPVSAGSAVNMTANSSGGAGVRFIWSFGDGTADTAPSTSAAASHVFANPGRYTVTVTAMDNTGAQISRSYAQAVYATLTAAKPTASSPIAYEVRSAASGRVWSVNPDNDSVSVFDTATNARVAEIAVGTQPETLAIAPDGRVWVANNKGSTLSIISPSTLTVVQTVSLARGSMPYGITFSPNNSDAWVVLEGTGKLLRLNPSTAATVATINVGANPRHVSITADSAKVLVTRFLTPVMPGESTGSIALTSTTNAGAEVVNVSPATNTIASTIILHHSDIPDSSTTGRGIPNYLGAAAISPDGRFAWVPSKQDNIKRGKLRDGQDLTHDSAVRSIVSRINLGTNAEDLASRVDFNDAGIAKAAAFDPRGIYLFVAHEGGREVAVVDAWNRAEIARFVTGRAPQGLVVSPDGSKLYVTNFMDRSVTVHDLSNLQAGGNASITTAATMRAVTTERLTAQVLLGKQHFYDSRDPRIALQQYISCAACHDDGSHDGRVWDFTGFGEGLRNTITLKGASGMGNGPVHWTGNFDEIQDFEGQIRHFDLGQGLMTDAQFNTGTRSQPLGDIKAGVSTDLDALAAYVATLAKTDVSPFRNADASLTAPAAAGKQVFAQLNCTACHSSSKYTDSALNNFHDVGTGKPSSGQRMNGLLPGFDTPTLRGLWTTAPYLHDGSATTLEAAILAHSKGTQLPTAGSQNLNDLVSYLQSIDNDEVSPATTFTVTLSAPSTATGLFTVQGSSAFSFFTGLSLSDFTVTNGSASNLVLNASAGTFQLSIAPIAAGNVTVTLPANTIGHSSGSANLASNITTTVVTLPPANRAPTITSPGNQSTVRGSAVSLPIVASDPDGNALNYTASNLPAGLSIAASTGLITGTVASTAAASYSASVTVSDGSLSASTSFTWVTSAPATATLASDTAVITTSSFIVNLSTSAAQSNVTNAQFTLTNASIQAIAGGSTAWAITLQPLAVGAMTLKWSNGSTTSNTLSLSYNPPAAFAAKVNFQPTSSPLPSGYIADSGSLYAARNGQTYGWTVSHTDQTRIRHIAVDPRQDTFIRMRINSRWEIAVPNGSYDVVLSVGDASAATRNSLNVEGSSVWSNQRLTANVFSVRTQRVLVGDGRLTLDCPSSDDFVTRINFIDIRAAGAPTIAGRVNGLTADYFAGRNFEQLRFTRIDSCIDNNWSSFAPDARLLANNFSVRWHGCVMPRYTENYTFTTTSDDGIRLWVNGALIIDQWNDHAATDQSGNIALTANVPAVIKVEFYENGGDAVSKFAWQSPSQSLEIVPNERLLMNETRTNVLPYPTTFLAWATSGRVTTTDPLANSDGDRFSNLLEYALGSSPTTGVQSGEGLRLDLDTNDRAQASLVRPIGLTDLVYTLEGSLDLRTWSTESIVPVITDLGDGTERLLWSSPSASILRVRVSLVGSTATDTTPPVAVQRLALNAGAQTVGVSVLRAPIFSGLIGSSANNLISLNEESSPGSLIDPEAHYYLEFISGSLVGHRIDIASIEDNMVALDWTSPRNTIASLPSNLSGDSVVIRPHVTLGSIFNPARFKGGNGASLSEQVLFYSKGNYVNYWLYRGDAIGDNRAWMSVSDVSFRSQDNGIIPPGAGVMIKLPLGATQTQLAFTGEIRLNAFVKQLDAGNNLIASPWPVPQSPASLGLTVANGFTGGNSVSQSDQIQVWTGDATPGTNSFTGYWLLNSSTMQRWVSSLNVSFTAMNNQPLLSANRAIFYNAKPSSLTRPWLIPMP